MKYIFLLLFFCLACSATESGQMISPDRCIEASVFLTDEDNLAYKVSYDGRLLCDTSMVWLAIDSLFYGLECQVRRMASKKLDDCNEYVYEVKPVSGNAGITLECRVGNDFFAYRFVSERDRVSTVKEMASWQMPADSRVWYSERNSAYKLRTYAGEWTDTKADSLHCVSSQGNVQVMPLLYQLEDPELYLMVTEAALYNYSGMRLAALPGARLESDFTEDDGFYIEGDVVTPWRVILIADNLNDLVNTKVISNLNPPPDSIVFGEDFSWIKGGRSLWSWWSRIDGRYLSVDGEKEVIDIASSMGYEYTTIDDGWEDWADKWGTLEELVDYAKEKDVGVFVWKSWNDLKDCHSNPVLLSDFLDRVSEIGAVGVKMDHINGESLDKINFMTDVLTECAKRKLMVNFHGAPKPTGESRTFPNEITREAVRGTELNRITEDYLRKNCIVEDKRNLKVGDERQCISARHNAILPFTRCILGAADYTPLAFSNPGDTDWGHQLAVAYLVSSPLITVAENPFMLRGDKRLDNVREELKAMPYKWDETIVLDCTELGQIAAMARRHGNDWYVAIANVNPIKELRVDLDFLPQGEYRMRLYYAPDKCNFEIEEAIVSASSELSIGLYRHSGCLASFTDTGKPSKSSN